jgi:hypothetical protein
MFHRKCSSKWDEGTWWLHFKAEQNFATQSCYRWYSTRGDMVCAKQMELDNFMTVPYQGQKWEMHK